MRGPRLPRSDEVLTPEALDLVAKLHRELDPRRRELLAAPGRGPGRAGRGRHARLPRRDARGSARATGQVSPPPPALRNRRVEITGPTSAKMVINALNSGSTGFMADFEDANSPTWQNMVGGQANLIDAVRGTLEHREGDKALPPGRARRPPCWCARAGGT